VAAEPTNPPPAALAEIHIYLSASCTLAISIAMGCTSSDVLAITEQAVNSLRRALERPISSAHHANRVVRSD
jgi:hypothetical protein